MPNTMTQEEVFPKAEGWTSESVAEERRLRLDNGATSCDQTEDDENFYLVTVCETL